MIVASVRLEKGLHNLRINHHVFTLWHAHTHAVGCREVTQPTTTKTRSPNACVYALCARLGIMGAITFVHVVADCCECVFYVLACTHTHTHSHTYTQTHNRKWLSIWFGRGWPFTFSSQRESLSSEFEFRFPFESHSNPFVINHRTNERTKS